MLVIENKFLITSSVVDYNGLSIYIYDCLIEYGNNPVVTTGISFDKSSAFEIMISETCERFCMFYHKIKNSTGMSAHKTLIQAFENSRKEVAERNFIKDLYFDSSIKPIFNINEGEVNYSFYKLNEDYYFSICRVRSRSCYSYGVSVGSNLEGLKQKSFLEAIMLNSFYTKSLIKGRVAAIESHFIDERNIVALDLVCFLGRYRYVVGIKDVK